jgi:L-asparaginase/Glu-tRNA(Gln) amidotransferase subunit D
MTRPYVNGIIEKVDESQHAVKVVQDATDILAVLAAVQEFCAKIKEATTLIQPDSLTTSEVEQIRAHINAAIDEANTATLVAYLSLSHPDDYERLILENRIPNI